MSQMNLRQPNDEQQAVINELDNNIILFASAGTGKTFSVARRVSHILDKELAKPNEILCLTFTIKAASEMKEDIATYAGAKAKNINVSTIHSFCFQVIREESKFTDEAVAEPMVCDDVDEGEELKNILQSMGMQKTERSEKSLSVLHSPAFLTGFMSNLKRQRELSDLYTEDPVADYQCAFDELLVQMGREKLLSFYDKSVRQKGIDNTFYALMVDGAGKMASIYDDILQMSNRVDFDDLVCKVHRHWKKGEWLDRWGLRYKFIFIDEMQDTSTLEYDTLRRIFPGANIMMCGDFFQTIYEWRHSDPEKVLAEFAKDYHARRFMFRENYRSTQNLVNASFGYLRNTFPSLVGQFCPETIQINNRDVGEKILVVRAETCLKEAEWIYHYLRDNPSEDPSRVCVMARSNGYIGTLAERLTSIAINEPEEQRLRFFTVDKDFRFFKRPLIKDIMAFFSVLQNDSDIVSMTRIVDKYCRGIGPAAIANIREHQTLGISLTSFLNRSYRQTGDPYTALISGMEADNIVIYDTETTGLDLEKDQVLQISAIRMDRNARIVDTLDQLVIPTIEISEGALATHHKSYEDIVSSGGVSIEKALRKFSAFVDGAVLVGHNSLRFDSPLVRRQLAECALPSLNIVAEYDTMVMAQQFIPESVNYKLETLCDFFGEHNTNAHDALGDITATGKVLFHLLREYVVPRTEERITFLQKYRDRFMKFAEFMDSLSELLQRGDLRTLAKQIIVRLDPEKKYKARSTPIMLDDFLTSLPSEPINNPYLYLRTYLNDATLSGSQMDILIRKLHKIPIITVHQSKGCEFDTVIIAGADDRNFPSYMAVQEGMQEEEKRVFYVAITRAKRKLILTYATGDDTWRKTSYSPYIRYIPREYGQSISV